MDVELFEISRAYVEALVELSVSLQDTDPNIDVPNSGFKNFPDHN